MMNMEHRLAQTQTQRLMLTQKMQQAIQILQLSMLELDQYVQEELETNPVLEQIANGPELTPVQNKQDGNGDTDGKSLEDMEFNLDDYRDSWRDIHREGKDLSRNPDADGRRQFYEDSITREESFTSRLLAQLNFAAHDEETYAIGEQIIGEIDGRGYFVGSCEEIAERLNVSVERVNEVLHLVQQFEPTGVGARDVIECLLLQIDAEYPDEDELRVLVTQHLEALEHRQIPKIAKAMNISHERVEELRDELAKLNPWPGHEYSDEPPQYVVPDVIVEKNEETDEYEVYLAGETAPELRISGDYQKMAQMDDVDSEAKKFLRDKLESARWLIRNIQQRQQTILRIAVAIVEIQRDFFDRGQEYLKPLTLQEVADIVGVHEATVSRATRGKYMQTPQGLFEMKYFFSPGLKHDQGGEQSSRSVQTMIENIVDQEDKRKPLSDQKIADELKKRGINIARRTVTKYRESLGILSTSLRRSYQEQ